MKINKMNIYSKYINMQYADDTSLFLKDKEDLEKALNIFDLFDPF